MYTIKLPNTSGLFTKVIRAQSNSSVRMETLIKDVHKLLIELLEDNKILINATGYYVTQDDMIPFYSIVAPNGTLDLKMFETAMQIAVDGINKDNVNSGLLLSADVKKDQCVISLTRDFAYV